MENNLNADHLYLNIKGILYLMYLKSDIAKDQARSMIVQLQGDKAI